MREPACPYIVTLKLIGLNDIYLLYQVHRAHFHNESLSVSIVVKMYWLIIFIVCVLLRVLWTNYVTSLPFAWLEMLIARSWSLILKINREPLNWAEPYFGEIVFFTSASDRHKTSRLSIKKTDLLPDSSTSSSLQLVPAN